VIVNGVARSATGVISVTALIEELGITPRGIAVAINGEIVRRSAWPTAMVQESDVVEIVTAVAGG